MSYSLAFTQALYILIYVGNKVELGLYDYIPTQTVSHDLNIPPSSAGMILRRLNRAGFIETREGANGGIRLGVRPESITALDVFNAIEQGRPLFQSEVTLNVSGEKTVRARQALTNVFTKAESAMMQSLASVTIRNLMDQTSP
jgi:Rrf2 family protein